MDVARIADTICEQIDTGLQELLNEYIESKTTLDFDGFSDYCLYKGIAITEDILEEVLANSERYLFTESEGGWMPILIDKLESELAL